MRDLSPLLEGHQWKGTMCLPLRLHDEVERIAQAQGIPWSKALRDLIMSGLRAREWTRDGRDVER